MLKRGSTVFKSILTSPPPPLRCQKRGSTVFRSILTSPHSPIHLGVKAGFHCIQKYPYLSHADEHPEDEEEVGVCACADGGEDVEDGDGEHADGDDPLGAETLADRSADDLQDEVAPEESAQQQALKLFVPAELALLPDARNNAS